MEKKIFNTFLVFIIILCSFVMTFCSFESKKRESVSSSENIVLSSEDIISSLENVASLDKIFIGYYYEYPVFDAYEEKKIYILKENLELFKKYPENYDPRVVNDKFICYEEKINDQRNIVITFDDIEKKYPIQSYFTFVALDKTGTIFYTDLLNDDSIKSISINGDIKKIDVNGYVIDVIGNKLYYFLPEPDSPLMCPDENIFEYDLNLFVSKKILTNVAGEDTKIMPNQKYIYGQKLIDGGFKPILYNVDKKEYTQLNIEEALSHIPFYSYQKNKLIFYNSKTLKTQEITLN